MRSCYPGRAPPIIDSNDAQAGPGSSGDTNHGGNSASARLMNNDESESQYDAASMMQSDAGMSSFSEYGMNPYSYTCGSTSTPFRPDQDPNILASRLLHPIPSAMPPCKRAIKESYPKHQISVEEPTVAAAQGCVPVRRPKCTRCCRGWFIFVFVVLATVVPLVTVSKIDEYRHFVIPRSCRR